MTGGDEASGFEHESGSESGRAPGGGWLLTDAEAAEAIRLSDQEEAERYRAHARAEPGTDAMPSLLPELPEVRRSARDQVVELLTPYMENEPGTRDGLFAWDVLEHITHQEQYMSARQRLDQAAAAGVTP